MVISLMALPIPPLQDVVRLTGHDVPSTITNYRRHLQGSGPVWGYGPAKRLAKAAFSLEMTRQMAAEECGRRGHVLGRPHNEEVGGLIWDAAHERGQFMCHDLAPRQLNLRADISVKVDPQFFFIANGRPVLFYLQPRRSHVPGRHGLQIIASAIHTLFAVDDLAGSDLLLLDLSVPQDAGQRVVRTFGYRDLPPLPTTEIETFFQRFVDAYDILTKEGVVQKARRPRPSRDLDDGLFGPEPPR